MMSSIFVQFRLIWATFHTTGDLTILVSSKVPLLSSDLKNVFTKHFPKKQPFVNALQIRCYYKFPNIHKKISVLEYIFNKVRRLMTCNFTKKETTTPAFSYEYHKMYVWEKLFFMKHLRWLLLRMAEEFLKAVLHRTICMIRPIWTCKLRNCMIRFYFFFC